MKILHLTTHLNRGGISNYVLSLGHHFCRRGHRLAVVSSGGEMENEFRENGFLVRSIPIRTKSELSPRIYRALPDLIRWVKQEQIDILHAHTRITQVMAQWTQWLTGKPFVTTCHGFYKRRFGRRLLPAWGERTVAISDPVADHLKEVFHVPTRQIRVIYNGVDLQRFHEQYLRHDPVIVRREYGFREGAPVIGVTARLVPDKGHEFLIRALVELIPEFPDLGVLIVGDGRHREHLESLADGLRLRDHIHFTGNLRDVSKPLAAMDLFVLPAVWREGFGLSIVEAMACGKPVVVTNIWALNALVQNGVNGVLVEPRNVAGLAEGIRGLLRDREFREKIGKTGRQTAEERFSLDRMIQELERVYEEILQR